MLSSAEIDFLRSLNDSNLMAILETQSREQQIQILQELAASEIKTDHDKDVERKREKRSEAARIIVPEVANPKRRELCLSDPERFLRTYFADRYKKEFDKDRKYIVDTMWDLARTKGRNAMAAPRGRGKTEIVKGMIVAIILAELARFPFVGGQTTAHGWAIYNDIRNKFATNDILFEDFPEVCHPIRELAGAPQRAAKQHIDGKLTRIVWKSHGYLSLPYVQGSPYGGVKLSYFGLDAAFRGKNIEGDRPDFVCVDDPETEESARSYEQIEKREKLLNQDIAGLIEEGEEIALAVFTTVQNRYCLSYKLTDKKISPQYGGVRFGMIERWPNTVEDATDESKLGLWSDYIILRQKDQMNGDKHGRSAVEFYLENKAEMDDGVQMLSDSYARKQLEDGTDLVFSAVQVAFNKIADTSLAAYRTEYQNDPEEVEQAEAEGLTAAIVQSRNSGLEQGEYPSECKLTTIGIDLGKYASHWTEIAWSETGCIGSVVDYGIIETYGLDSASDNTAIELALIESLETFAKELSGRVTPSIVLVDSGNWASAVYDFCRKMGRPFYAAKGWDQGRFRIPKTSKHVGKFTECYSRLLPDERLMLFNVQTEYWKKRFQDGFLLRTFDSEGKRVNGSMAIFDNAGDRRRHFSFAQHAVSEEEQWIPIEGKELRRKWIVKSRNNHWLDSSALACAGAAVSGISMIDRPKPKPLVRKRSRVAPLAC